MFFSTHSFPRNDFSTDNRDTFTTDSFFVCLPSLQTNYHADYFFRFSNYCIASAISCTHDQGYMYHTALLIAWNYLKKNFLKEPHLTPPKSCGFSSVNSWKEVIQLLKESSFSVLPFVTSTNFFSLLILSRRTCCRVRFPPWCGLHVANNRCRRSYFDTFQFYFTSSWRMVGVWYLVSLEIAMPEQIEQSGFNAITQTILWP